MILPVRPHFIFDLIPKTEQEPFSIPVPCRESGAPNMLEMALLLACGRIVKAERIFEIGTFKGMTARTLRVDFPDADVDTLDLTPDRADKLLGGSNVTRHRGHSMLFDFAAIRGSGFDLVFIDGAHDAETVQCDSVNAVKLIPTSGPAAIVWHDYSPQWPGVQKACREFASERALTMYHVEDTSLCIYLRGAE